MFLLLVISIKRTLFVDFEPHKQDCNLCCRCPAGCLIISCIDLLQEIKPQSAVITSSPRSNTNKTPSVMIRNCSTWQPLSWCMQSTRNKTVIGKQFIYSKISAKYSKYIPLWQRTRVRNDSKWPAQSSTVFNFPYNSLLMHLLYKPFSLWEQTLY